MLISPHAFGSLHQAGKLLLVNLTRKQIENSPSIESHKPVSRQYEEEYYRYYGWPYYWQGDGLWGMSGFPILELPANLYRASQPLRVARNPNAPMRICGARKPWAATTSRRATGSSATSAIS